MKITNVRGFLAPVTLTCDTFISFHRSTQSLANVWMTP
jgi:hypothetical protein